MTPFWLGIVVGVPIGAALVVVIGAILAARRADDDGPRSRFYVLKPYDNADRLTNETSIASRIASARNN